MATSSFKTLGNIERNLAKVGMEAEFPLWGRDSGELARRFIKLGFKAVITCVDGERLAGEFVGKEFDENFLSSLPSNIDPQERTANSTPSSTPGLPSKGRFPSRKAKSSSVKTASTSAT